MNLKTNFKRICIFSTLITLVTTVLLTVCFTSSFDSETGYFNAGALSIIFWIFYIAGIILSLAVTLLINKTQVIKTPNEIGVIKIPMLLIALILTICAMMCNSLLLVPMITLLILGALSFAIYIMLCTSKDGYARSGIKMLFAYISVVMPLSMIMQNNADYTRHVNSVENTLTVLFGISFMAYILYEAKRIYEGHHSRWHVGTMLVAIHTGLSFSLSYIIAYLSGTVDEKTRFLHVILILATTVFIIIELLRFVLSAEAHTKEEWEEIENPDPQETENTVEETTIE